MAQLLGRASQGQKMFCHNPVVVGLNASLVELGVGSPFV